MSYADAVKTAEYARARTLRCRADNPDERYKIEHLMEELIKYELGSDIIQRVTKLKEKGSLLSRWKRKRKKNQSKKYEQPPLKQECSTTPWKMKKKLEMGNNRLFSRRNNYRMHQSVHDTVRV